jgi:hypothetical protein
MIALVDANSIDALWIAPYPQHATESDMRRNLILSSYLVNRSLPGAETREKAPRVSGEPSAPALLVRRASSGSKCDRHTRRAGTRVSFGLNNGFSKGYLWLAKGLCLFSRR